MGSRNKKKVGNQPESRSRKRSSTSISSASLTSIAEIASEKSETSTDCITPRSIRYARRSGSLASAADTKVEETLSSGKVGKSKEGILYGQVNPEKQSLLRTASTSGKKSNASPVLAGRKRQRSATKALDTSGVEDSTNILSSAVNSHLKATKRTSAPAVDNSSQLNIHNVRHRSSVNSSVVKPNCVQTGAVADQGLDLLGEQKNSTRKNRPAVAAVSTPHSASACVETDPIQVPAKKKQKHLSGAVSLESAPGTSLISTSNFYHCQPGEKKKRSASGHRVRNRNAGGLAAHGQPSETTGSCASSKLENNLFFYSNRDLLQFYSVQFIFYL